MYVDREKALEQGEKLNVVGGPAWRTGFPHETVCCHEGRGGHFCPEISRQACWRATNYIQFFSLLQSFFSVYIHHISVILLNKRTFLSPCYARRKRKKLGTQKQLQEGKQCCKVTKQLLYLSAMPSCLWKFPQKQNIIWKIIPVYVGITLWPIYIHVRVLQMGLCQILHSDMH